MNKISRYVFNKYIKKKMDMEARQKEIDEGNRHRSKSYQVRTIVVTRPVSYYVTYFEVL